MIPKETNLRLLNYLTKCTGHEGLAGGQSLDILIENKKMKNFPIVKSRRLRSTIYSSRIEKQGLKSYTVYNHMLLPAGFSDS